MAINTINGVATCDCSNVFRKCHEQGEPTASYRRTGWVWEITGWSSGFQEN